MKAKSLKKQQPVSLEPCLLPAAGPICQDDVLLLPVHKLTFAGWYQGGYLPFLQETCVFLGVMWKPDLVTLQSSRPGDQLGEAGSLQTTTYKLLLLLLLLLHRTVRS